MNIVRSVGVTYVSVRAYLNSCWNVFTQPTEVIKEKAQLDWLLEDRPNQLETKLVDDVKTLRMLEAEIYTLNDQINTEVELYGAVAS